MVASAVVRHVTVVVEAEVALAAGADVAQVAGATLRLVVAVQFARHDGRFGAGVAVLKGLGRFAVVLVAVQIAVVDLNGKLVQKSFRIIIS